MIEDCKQHKIDMILTKSLSRFSRNTLDSIRYIRLLKSLGVVIVFEKEGLNTGELGIGLYLFQPCRIINIEGVESFTHSLKGSLDDQ